MSKVLQYRGSYTIADPWSQSGLTFAPGQRYTVSDASASTLLGYPDLFSLVGSLSSDGGSAPGATVTSVAGRTGDVVIDVTDVNNAASIAYVNQQVGQAGGGIVSSVAGKTGAVTLVLSDVAGAAGLASPAFTGTPTVPTAVVDTNSGQAASTAFVIGQAASATPLVNGAAAVGSSTRFARADHVHPTDTSRMTNPMTTAGDLVIGGSSGTPGRLAVGSTNQVLTVVGGVPIWSNSAAGFVNPMTTAGDLIVGSIGGSAIRQGIGANGSLLGVAAGAVTWMLSPTGVQGDGLTDQQIGYRNLPLNNQAGNYTCQGPDSGRMVRHPSSATSPHTYTIPANASVALPIGACITFVNQNGAGTLTIAITSDTLRLAGSTLTGSRTLAANGVATAVKTDTTEWLISGSGLS